MKCLAGKLNNRIEWITKNDTDSITCELISTQKRPVSFSPVYFNQIIYFSLAFGKCVHENEHSQIH